MKTLVAALKIGLVAGVLAILGMSIAEPVVQATVCEGEGHSCHVISGGMVFHFKEIAP